MPSTVTLSGPGTATITDDAAAVLTAQLPTVNANLAAIVLQLTRIQGTSAEINSSIIELKKATVAMASSAKALEIAMTALNSATAQGNAVQAAMASNQIQTNNFSVAATKAALERTGQPIPVLPDIKTQLTDAVQGSVQMTAVATTSGAVTAQANAAIGGMTTFITGTKVYKTVASWLDEAKDFIFVVIPDSAKDIASKIAGKLGISSGG